MTPAPSPAIGGLSADALSSMLQSIEGLRNRRALAAILGCMVAGVLVAGLFSLMAAHLGFLMAFVGVICLFVATATGINAAGVLLMDQARGLPLRTLADAVTYGLACIPKFILLGLSLLLVAIGVFIVLMVAYLICKIPVLGPLLFVAVFPLSVVIAGLTLCALFLCLFLALPAIWEGLTITRAIAQALTIARSRLIESIVLLAVVGLLAMVVGFIVFGVLFMGLVPSIGMSASILGGDGLHSMLEMMRAGGQFGDADGGVSVGGASYALAAGVGTGLLWSLAGSLLSLVYLLGLNLVYLRVTEGLDVDSTEAAMKSGLSEAKRQAAELGQKARDAAERVREPARPTAQPAHPDASAPLETVDPVTPEVPAQMVATPIVQPPTPVVQPPAPIVQALSPIVQPAAPNALPSPAAKTAICPKCQSAVDKNDVFCGVCGNRLK